MEDAIAPPGPLSLRHQGQVSFHLQPPALHLHPQALGPEGRQHPRPGDGVVGRHPQPRGRLPLDHAALQPPVLAGGEQFPALLRRQHHHGRAGKGLGKAVAGVRQGGESDLPVPPPGGHGVAFPHPPAPVEHPLKETDKEVSRRHRADEHRRGQVQVDHPVAVDPAAGEEKTQPHHHPGHQEADGVEHPQQPQEHPRPLPPVGDGDHDKGEGQPDKKVQQQGIGREEDDHRAKPPRRRRQVGSRPPLPDAGEGLAKAEDEQVDDKIHRHQHIPVDHIFHPVTSPRLSFVKNSISPG